MQLRRNCETFSIWKVSDFEVQNFQLTKKNIRVTSLDTTTHSLIFYIH